MSARGRRCATLHTTMSARGGDDARGRAAPRGGRGAGAAAAPAAAAAAAHLPPRRACGPPRVRRAAPEDRARTPFYTLDHTCYSVKRPCISTI